MIQDVQQTAKATLAACAAFQSLVGASNATDAAARIYHDSWPTPASGGPVHTLAEATALRPCAIVYTEDDRGFVAERDASADQCWHNSGCVRFIIFRNVPSADFDNPSKVDVDFRTVVGNILSNLISLSETAGYLACRRIATSGPHRTSNNDMTEIGDAQAYEMIVEWGVK